MNRSLIICLAFTLMNGCLRRGDELSRGPSSQGQNQSCDPVAGGACASSQDALDARASEPSLDFRVAPDDAFSDDLDHGNTQRDCRDSGSCMPDTTVDDAQDMEILEDMMSPVCTPRAATACFEDDVYWFDSCGAREEVSVACDDPYICVDDGTPRCVCTPEVSSACSGDVRYWYDACGERGEVRERCPEGQTCLDDACVSRVSGLGTCQDPLRMIGTSSASISSCDLGDTLSICGSQGVREVAVLIIADTPCQVQVMASDASFHVTSGQCAESSSCLGGIEFFQQNVSGQALIIAEPRSCGSVNVDVSCQ